MISITRIRRYYNRHSWRIVVISCLVSLMIFIIMRYINALNGPNTFTTTSPPPLIHSLVHNASNDDVLKRDIKPDYVYSDRNAYNDDNRDADADDDDADDDDADDDDDDADDDAGAGAGAGARNANGDAGVDADGDIDTNRDGDADGDASGEENYINSNELLNKKTTSTSPMYDDDDVHVVFCFSAMYIIPVLTAINSTVNMSQDRHKLHIYLLSDVHGAARMKSILEHQSTVFPNSSHIELKVFDESVVENVKVWKGPLNLAAPLNYARFHLTTIFTHLERIIYLDPDIVVQRDVAKMWTTYLQDDSYVIAAVTGEKQYRSFLVDNVPATKQFDRDELYFNAGVLMINLKEWRRRGMSIVTNKWIRMNIHQMIYKYGSQPPLMLAFYRDYEPMDPSWNVRHLGHKENLDLNVLRKAKILHYNGPRKPWLQSAIRDYVPLWRRYFQPSRLVSSLAEWGFEAALDKYASTAHRTCAWRDECIIRQHTEKMMSMANSVFSLDEYNVDVVVGLDLFLSPWRPRNEERIRFIVGVELEDNELLKMCSGNSIRIGAHPLVSGYFLSDNLNWDEKKSSLRRFRMFVVVPSFSPIRIYLHDNGQVLMLDKNGHFVHSLSLFKFRQSGELSIERWDTLWLQLEDLSIDVVLERSSAIICDDQYENRKIHECDKSAFLLFCVEIDVDIGVKKNEMTPKPVIHAVYASGEWPQILVSDFTDKNALSVFYQVLGDVIAIVVATSNVDTNFDKSALLRLQRMCSLGLLNDDVCSREDKVLSMAREFLHRGSFYPIFPLVNTWRNIIDARCFNNGWTENPMSNVFATYIVPSYRNMNRK